MYHREEHLVWGTPSRDQVLTGDVALRVRARGRPTCALFELQSRKGGGRKAPGPLRGSAPPHLAPSASRRRSPGRRSSKLGEAFPRLKKRSGGRPGWARGYLCAPVGQLTDEMIPEYLAHHCEPKPSDNLRTADSPRVWEPYPDCQSIELTHQLELVVV